VVSTGAVSVAAGAAFLPQALNADTIMVRASSRDKHFLKWFIGYLLKNNAFIFRIQISSYQMEQQVCNLNYIGCTLTRCRHFFLKNKILPVNYENSNRKTQYLDYFCQILDEEKISYKIHGLFNNHFPISNVESAPVKEA
jgi:hypothetical protein